MRSCTLLIAAVLCLPAFHVSGQTSGTAYSSQKERKPEKKTFHFGVGLGQDYGGAGGRLEIRPLPYVSGFFGFGYNLHRMGYNLGVRGYYPTGHRVEPFLTAMYGYNGVIIVGNNAKYSRTYYGYTAGGGIDVRVGRDKNKFSFALLVPLRSSEWHDDYNRLKKESALETSQEPLPFTISLGFNFIL